MKSMMIAVKYDIILIPSAVNCADSTLINENTFKITTERIRFRNIFIFVVLLLILNS